MSDIEVPYEDIAPDAAESEEAAEDEGVEIDLEAPEADAAEQRRIVELDEDEEYLGSE
ncbi:MAG TPA: hypothetical protein VI076_14605 [Actinopolymorphaceae bacterium]